MPIIKMAKQFTDRTAVFVPIDIDLYPSESRNMSQSQNIVIWQFIVNDNISYPWRKPLNLFCSIAKQSVSFYNATLLLSVYGGR